MTATRPKSSDVANRFRCRAGVSLAALLAGLGLSGTPARAVDGTWVGLGSSWNSGANWSSTPTVPDGTATFTNNGAPEAVGVSGTTSINTIVFNAGAPAFTIIQGLGATLNILGAGIVNNSANRHTFNATGFGGGIINFNNSSTAANVIISNGSSTVGNRTLNFNGASSAANALIDNTLSAVNFNGTSTAGSANILNSSGTVSFRNASTAGNATILNVNSAFSPATIAFYNNSTAGNAAITNNVTTRSQSVVDFSNTTGAAGDGRISAGSIAGNGNFVLGANELTVGGNNQSTEVAGQISGVGGSLVKVGTGTLILAGDNTYTGGTTINGGTLQIGNGATTGGTLPNGYRTGSILGNVVNNGTLAFNRIDSLDFTGQISGTGAVSHIGSGVTTLTAVNTYTGATVIDAGILNVTGSIASSSGVAVNSGATLSGTGIVAATTVNGGGTLAPGTVGSPLTVNGSLTFNSGSTYAVTLTPSSSTRVDVTGAASLTGGTVNTTFDPGSYVARSYTILTSSGLGNTTFTGVTGTLPGFDVALGYSATDVTLTLTAMLGGGISSDGLSGNGRNVADAINSYFNNGGTLPPGFLGLFGLSQPALGSALAQIAGEPGASGGVIGSTQLTTSFLSLLLNMSPGNRSHSGFAAAGYAEDRRVSSQAAAAYAALDRAAGPPVDRRWNIWAASFGGQALASGDSATGATATRASTFGVAAGVDYRVSPESLVGFALAGGGTRWSVDNNLGGGKSDVFQLGLYGRHDFGASYVAAAASYALNTMSTDRTVTVSGTDMLTASFNAHNIGGRLEVGHSFATRSPVGVTPYAALQTQALYLPAYAETSTSGSGTFALAYASRTATSTRAELGARFDTRQLTATGDVNLFVRAAWAHDWNSDPSVTASFQTLPGTSFTVNGAARPDNLALLSTGAEIAVASNVTLFAKFDGEFADGYQSYAGSAALRYAF